MAQNLVGDFWQAERLTKTQLFLDPPCFHRVVLIRFLVTSNPTISNQNSYKLLFGPIFVGCPGILLMVQKSCVHQLKLIHSKRWFSRRISGCHQLIRSILSRLSMGLELGVGCRWKPQKVARIFGSERLKIGQATPQKETRKYSNHPGLQVRKC